MLARDWCRNEDAHSAVPRLSSSCILGFSHAKLAPHLYIVTLSPDCMTPVFDRLRQLLAVSSSFELKCIFSLKKLVRRSRHAGPLLTAR